MTDSLLLRDYRPESLLRVPENVPATARFPVIDAHNHLFGNAPAAEIVRTMDEVGVAVFVNVTGNARLPLGPDGYSIERRDLRVFLDEYAKPHPRRFAAFTSASFAQWDDFQLFRGGHSGGAARWVDGCIAALEADVAAGALGLKVTKELGLRFLDDAGSVLRVDDERLFPVWRRAGELGVPVLIHTADPLGFFLPVDGANEHYMTLADFPGWSFAGSRYAPAELLRQRDRMIAAHPGTRFICPHVASQGEDLAAAGRFLDAHPNASIDLSARLDELGRQPRAARAFLVRYRDRVLFGADMPVSTDVYRCYFRFLETADEYFEYPDYAGRWGRSRWRIGGVELPHDVLRLVYHGNAMRLMPRLEDCLPAGH